jgi:hypothetical protein
MASASYTCLSWPVNIGDLNDDHAHVDFSKDASPHFAEKSEAVPSAWPILPSPLSVPKTRS